MPADRIHFRSAGFFYARGLSHVGPPTDKPGADIIMQLHASVSRRNALRF